MASHEVVEIVTEVLAENFSGQLGGRMDVSRILAAQTARELLGKLEANGLRVSINEERAQKEETTDEDRAREILSQLQEAVNAIADSII